MIYCSITRHFLNRQISTVVNWPHRCDHAGRAVFQDFGYMNTSPHRKDVIECLPRPKFLSPRLATSPITKLSTGIVEGILPGSVPIERVGFTFAAQPFYRKYTIIYPIRLRNFQSERSVEKTPSYPSAYQGKTRVRPRSLGRTRDLYFGHQSTIGQGCFPAKGKGSCNLSCQ